MQKNIRLKFPKKINLSWQTLLEGFYLSNNVFITLYMFLVLGFEYLWFTDGIGNIVVIYFLGILLIGIHFLKRVLGSGDFFPTVAFDLETLILVSTVVLSLLLNILIFKNTKDVWGTTDTKLLSAISVVAFWFIYYLISINSQGKETLKKFFVVFNIGFYVALILYVFSLSSKITNIADMFVVFMPAFIYMVLQDGKIKWIGLANLMPSIILLFFASASAQVTTLFVLFVEIVFCVFRNKKTISRYRRLISLLSVGLTISLLSLLLNQNRVEISLLLTHGFQSIQGALTLQTFFFGNGLSNIGTLFQNIFFSFGILPLMAFIYLTTVYVKTVTKLDMKKNTELVPFRKILNISFLSLILYFVIGAGSGVSIAVFWVLTIFASIFVSVNKSHKPFLVVPKVNSFQGIDDESVKEFLSFLQKVILIVLILGIIFLENQLQYMS